MACDPSLMETAQILQGKATFHSLGPGNCCATISHKTACPKAFQNNANILVFLWKSEARTCGKSCHWCAPSRTHATPLLYDLVPGHFPACSLPPKQMQCGYEWSWERQREPGLKKPGALVFAELLYGVYSADQHHSVVVAALYKSYFHL